MMRVVDEVGQRKPQSLYNKPLYYVAGICTLFSLSIFSFDMSFVSSRYIQLPRVQTRDYPDANIAFLIQTYSKSLPLIPSLLEVIWHPQNVYAIHIDAKTGAEESKSVIDFISREPYRNNVFVMPSEHVSYLGITTVLNTINAMSFLLSKSHDWDFFINLSGADYPLTSAHSLRLLLGRSDILDQGLNFMQNFGNPENLSEEMYNSRFTRFVVDRSLWIPFASEKQSSQAAGSSSPSSQALPGGLWRSKKNTVTHPLLDPKNGRLPLVKTEAWFIFHRSFANYVVNSAPSRRMLSIFANVPCPEEFFFGTLLYGSEHFRDTAVDDAFRVVLWSEKEEGSGSRPPDLDTGVIKNVTDILAERPGFFCRKRTKTTSEVKDFIDNELLGSSGEYNSSSSSPRNDSMYWLKTRQRVDCIVKHRCRTGPNYALYRECMKEPARMVSDVE